MKNSSKILKYVWYAFFLLFFSSCQSIKLDPFFQDTSRLTLFDGKSLDNWEKTDFAGKGEIFIDENGSLVLEMGAELSGLHWKGEPLPSRYKFHSGQKNNGK